MRILYQILWFFKTPGIRKKLIAAQSGYLQGHYKESAAILEKLMRRDYFKHYDMFEISNACYASMREPSRASELFDEYVSLFPKDKDNKHLLDLVGTAWNNRGYYFTTIGKYIDALADLDKAIEIKPASAFAYNNRGLARIRLGMVEEGYRDILCSKELNENNSYMYRNMGIYYLVTGEYQQALLELKKSQEIDPKTPDLQELIAEVESKL